MKKSRLSSLLLASLITIGLAGCGGNTESTNSSNTPAPSNSVETSTPVENSTPDVVSSTISSAPASVIKSLEANAESFDIKIGEKPSITSFYKIQGYKSLNAKQKKVTVTSSDPTIVEVQKNNLIAAAMGSAVITIVSQEDETKSCTFTINVGDAFFDRELCTVDSTWDFAHEMDETNPYVTVKTDVGAGMYIRNSDGLKWFIETEISIGSVLSGENWPKFGLVANTVSYTTEENNNKLYYFLDAPMNSTDNWVNFGVCEVRNANSWAWNAGIDNSVARHNDAVFANATPITYNTVFKMGMIREGSNFHLYLNNEYRGSITVLDDLFCNYDEATQGYTAQAAAYAGFFSFNSVATFSNYRFVNDEAQVNEMLTAIGTPNFNTNWAAD